MRGKIYIFGMRITSTNIFLLVLLIITKSLDVFPTGDVEPLDLIRNDPEAPLEQQQKPHLDVLGQSIPSYGSNFTIWSNFFILHDLPQVTGTYLFLSLKIKIERKFCVKANCRVSNPIKS